jgi:hypothetical protein
MHLQETPSSSTELIDVLSPLTQEVLLKVPCTTQNEMEAAIAVLENSCLCIWDDFLLLGLML